MYPDLWFYKLAAYIYRIYSDICTISEYTFSDTCSIYSYHMVEFHNKTMIVIIMILILVYWCLYRILIDYSPVKHNIYVDNEQECISSELTSFRGLYNPRKLYSRLYLIYLVSRFKLIYSWMRFYNDTRDICHIYELGVEESKPSLFLHLTMRAFNVSTDKLMGSQRRTWNKINRRSRYIAIDGNWMVASERRYWSAIHKHVIISEWFNVKEGYLPFLEKRDLQKQNMDDNYLEIEKRWLLIIANFINYQLNMRSIESKLYSYKTSSLFYNGRLNKVTYSRRRSRALNHFSTYGILEVVGRTSTEALARKTSTNLMRKINILNYRIKNVSKFASIDIFFEWQRFKHSFLFELIWAAYPTIIIFNILIPSLYLLYSLDDEIDPDLVVKVIGHQWYWSYEFDNWVEIETDVYKFVSFKFDSNIVQNDDLAFGAKRLLEVDKRLVLPVNFMVRFVITSSDVLHAWAVPQLGVKSDAVPGRLNQFLAFITCPGVYYGHVRNYVVQLMVLCQLSFKCTL